MQDLSWGMQAPSSRTHKEAFVGSQVEMTLKKALKIEEKKFSWLSEKI